MGRKTGANKGDRYEMETPVSHGQRWKKRGRYRGRTSRWMTWRAAIHGAFAVVFYHGETGVRFSWRSIMVMMRMRCPITMRHDSAMARHRLPSIPPVDAMTGKNEDRTRARTVVMERMRRMIRAEYSLIF